MNLNKILNCEQSKIDKWSRFQLQHSWKKIGFCMALLSFLAMVGLKFIEGEPDWIKALLRHGLLLGLLIASIAKEPVEDEMITKLRSQSYTLAFIIGVLYSIVQPFANVLVAQFLETENDSLELGYFQVLVFMLLIQLLFFEVLTRNR